MFADAKMLGQQLELPVKTPECRVVTFVLRMAVPCIHMVRKQVKQEIIAHFSFPDGAKSAHGLSDARQQLYAYGNASLLSAVGQYAAVHIVSPQTCKVCKRYAAQLKYGSCQQLRTLHGQGIQPGIKQSMELFYIQCFFASGVNACVYMTEKPRTERGYFCIHTTVVYAAKHTQISGNGVG